MKTAEEIHRHYERLRDKAIAQLRASCKHAHVSHWETEWWTLAHPTGFEVQYCQTCETVLHRKTNCKNFINGKQCSREIVYAEICEGDGKTLPLGGHYCKDCMRRSGVRMERPIGRGPRAEVLVRRMRDKRAKGLLSAFGSNPRLRKFKGRDETETHETRG
jgi:hypothetical protein